MDKVLQAKISKANSKNYSVKTVASEDAITDEIKTMLEVFKKSIADREVLIEKFVDQVKDLVESNKDNIPQDNSNKIIQAINSLDLKPVVNIEKEQIVIPEPVVKVVTNDVYDEYKVSDTKQDENGSLIYHGFLNRAGKWFVLMQSGDTNVAYRYASYKNNPITYRQAISNPSSLKFVYYNELEL